MNLRMPKMILFDYGQTLGVEIAHDPLGGNEAVLQAAAANPRGVTAQDVQKAHDAWTADLHRIKFSEDVEFHEHQIMQHIYDRLGVTFDRPLDEIETIFWDVASPAETTPHLDDILTCVRDLGLRSGVVSNISFSGKALSRRVRQLTRDHTFEFIVASSEVIFRKPHPQIFAYARDLAGLPSEDIWFIGDNTLCDVQGAADAGMVPIWYLCGRDNPFHDHRMPEQPIVPHLEISDWRQLVQILQQLAKTGELTVSG